MSISPNSKDDLILVVDDDPTLRMLARASLEKSGFRVEEAEDGEQALRKFLDHHPAVIMMDVEMPKLNGFEVCEKIKSDPKTRRIMVLMVTALNELGDIERAVAAGTDDFLSKPVQQLELLKRVDNMLRLKDVSDENERLRRYIEEMEASPKS